MCLQQTHKSTQERVASGPAVGLKVREFRAMENFAKNRQSVLSDEKAIAAAYEDQDPD